MSCVPEGSLQLVVLLVLGSLVGRNGAGEAEERGASSESLSVQCGGQLLAVVGAWRGGGESFVCLSKVQFGWGPAGGALCLGRRLEVCVAARVQRPLAHSTVGHRGGPAVRALLLEVCSAVLQARRAGQPAGRKHLLLLLHCVGRRLGARAGPLVWG